MGNRPAVTFPEAKVLRFAFGRNWQRFLRVVNDERIAEAEKSLRALLEIESLSRKSFLDVGSGSGLFSLAAMRLGAERVHSFDYDPQSVACTRELKRRYFPRAENWTIEEGSVLDSAYLAGLGRYDVVYSWGVLHHTGNMWKALENVAPLVNEGGKLFVAIYNDQGWVSDCWKRIKEIYNSNGLGRFAMILIFVPYLIGARFVIRALTGRLYVERGMSLWNDMVDWLGGYPFEVAKPKTILDFYKRRGLSITKLKTCGRRHGNNQFVFRKCAE